MNEQGVYRTIVADPPWHYDEFMHAGRTAGWRKRAAAGLPLLTQTDIERKRLPYQTMSVAEIAALPVSDLSESSAGCFLWTTNKYLPDAFDVLAAWGFSYRQTVVWDKIAFSPFGGSVAPNAAEFLLVGARGNHRWLARSRTSVIRVGKTRHSVKPEAFLDLVEEVSPGPYLEMFARRTRLGWDTWGDQALNHVTLGAVSVRGETR